MTNFACEANTTVKITGDSEPNDWPRWLRVAWNKSKKDIGSVYPVVATDDLLLMVKDFDGSVHEVREGDSLACDELQIYVIPRESN